LNDFLDEVNIMDLDRTYPTIYAEIDAYSQRLNPNFESYPFDTSRNMGKNNIWITSLAAMLGLKLVSTDADFDHLYDVFFEVRKIQPADFVPFF
jgi:tRNA(fMet)-specific endonuclease VapC